MTIKDVEDFRQMPGYGDVQTFTYEELRLATKNFRPDLILGEGGFGLVYKGTIDDNVRPGFEYTQAAVKRLNPDGHQGDKEWLLLIGRKALDRSRPSREHNLVEWARPLLVRRKRLFRVLDPRIRSQYSDANAERVARLASDCLSQNPKARPAMSEVVAVLRAVLRDEAGLPRPGSEAAVTLYEAPKEDTHSPAAAGTKGEAAAERS
ncbi:hypothetical protein BHM03_00036198 [Ensete ventricosum]|nr:hypothetical protein BHM03_00036198 [Ensete ventricosum]